jgi:hypothetical protein
MTRSRVATLIISGRDSTRETVPAETPASAATSASELGPTAARRGGRVEADVAVGRAAGAAARGLGIASGLGLQSLA